MKDKLQAIIQWVALGVTIGGFVYKVNDYEGRIARLEGQFDVQNDKGIWSKLAVLEKNIEIEKVRNENRPDDKPSDNTARETTNATKWEYTNDGRLFYINGGKKYQAYYSAEWNAYWYVGDDGVSRWCY